MNRISLSVPYFLMFGSAVVAQTPALPQSMSTPAFRILQVDAGKVTGTIRSFQGLNGPPSPIMEELPFSWS